MNDAVLRTAAVACSLIGLALVFVASQAIDITAEIAAMTSDNVGKSYRICGEAASKRIVKNHIFFTLSDGTGSIPVVVFNSTALKLNSTGYSLYAVKHNELLCATGKLTEYPKGSGKLEFVYSGRG